MTSTCGLRIAPRTRAVSCARGWRRPWWSAATTTSNDASSSSSKSSAPSPRISSSQPWRSRKPSGGRGGGRACRRPPRAAKRALRSRDDRALGAHPLRREAARDRQAVGVVGQDQVGVAAGAGRLGHLLDRVDPVRPVRVGVAVAAQVGQLHEARQRPGPGRLDLAAILAQLGRHLGEAQERVDLRLGRERPQLGGGPGGRLPVLAEPQEALLGEAPAAVAGDPAQPDVVLLAAR